MKRIVLAATAALVLAAPAFAVTGGTPDGGAHPAVGLLLADRGNGPEPECSGSLVSATVFVTAAHCTAQLPSARVWVSFDSQYAAGTSRLLTGTAHSDPQFGSSRSDSHDVAAVVLDASVVGTTPLALPQAGSLDKTSLRSQSFTNVGYGYFDRAFAFDGVRRVSSSSFTNLDATNVRLAENPGGVCFGDSGGPRLLGSTVVAVTTSGNKNCTGQSLSYRLDTPSARAFLSLFVAVP